MEAQGSVVSSGELGLATGIHSLSWLVFIGVLEWALISVGY